MASKPGGSSLKWGKRQEGTLSPYLESSMAPHCKVPRPSATHRGQSVFSLSGPSRAPSPILSPETLLLVPPKHPLHLLPPPTLSSKEVIMSVAQSPWTLCDPLDCSLPSSSLHGIFQAKNTGGGCNSLLQRIFAIQGSNPGLLHCRQTLYCLKKPGKPQ